MNYYNYKKIQKTNDGLEALVYSAQGDMRQAINNLQATYSAYGLINEENVFKVNKIKIWR